MNLYSDDDATFKLLAEIRQGTVVGSRSYQRIPSMGNFSRRENFGDNDAWKVRLIFNFKFFKSPFFAISRTLSEDVK